DLPGLRAIHPGERVDRHLGHLLGRLARDLLDVHAAGGRADGEEGAVRAVEQEGEVVLLRDLARLLDQDLADRVALDVHAENLLRLLVRVVGTVGELHAARFAAAPGLDLRLDNDSAGQRLGRRARLLRRVRDDAAWYWDAVLREEFFRLMFEQVHEGPSLSDVEARRRRLARRLPRMKSSPRPQVAGHGVPDREPG